MSSLESVLLELKQVLAAKGASAAVPAAPQSDKAVDTASASAALRQFISQAVMTQKASEADADESPEAIAARRKALSAFIGIPLGTGPVVQPTAPKPVTPAPSAIPPVAAAAPVPVPTPALAPAPAPAPAPALAAPSAPAPAVPPPAVATNFAWGKHINTVESALRIGDSHFADSLITLLNDISLAIPPDPSVRVRLKSQQARVRIDRKEYPEAQQLLMDALRSVEGTSHKRSVGAAYCWHALAQCYHLQKKTEQAETAQRNAISLADECVGPTDPEAKAFKQKLIP